MRNGQRLLRTVFASGVLQDGLKDVSKSRFDPTKLLNVCMHVIIQNCWCYCMLVSPRMCHEFLALPYSRKIWQFGGLAYDCHIKIRQYFILAYIYVWRSLTEPPNINLPIFLQWRFRAQPPNLIPANISGYTVCKYYSYVYQPGITAII